MAGEKASCRAGTLVVWDPVYLRHDPGPGRPESPARCAAVLERLIGSDIAERLTFRRGRPGRVGDVLACHSRAYLRQVRADVAAGRDRLSTGDTDIGPDSLAAAMRAVGGACRAVDEVLSGRFANAFCLLRPPGHHATRDEGMGFCIFNNAAVAARYAQRHRGIGKVLIVDWDVHHGNGTQDIFYDDPSVLCFNTHQSPWYPYTGSADETGAGKGRGTTINCPVAAGAGRKEIFGAFETKLLPAARRFRPELVIISAGFDSRVGDPLGELKLTDEDFAELTRRVGRLATHHAGGRLIAVLEGGYSLTGLASAAEAHCRALTSLAAGAPRRSAKARR